MERNLSDHRGRLTGEIIMDDGASVGSSSSSSSSAASFQESSLGTESTTRDHSRSSESSTSFSLAKQETLAVLRSKAVVLGAIGVAAAIIGFFTHLFLTNAETANFETSFHAYAVELSELVHFEAKNSFASVDEFSTTITSYALDAANNGSWWSIWPNVTLPHFEIRGRKNMELSKAVQTTFCPLVTVENRAGWEAYSDENLGWLIESSATEALFDDPALDGGDTHRQRTLDTTGIERAEKPTQSSPRLKDPLAGIPTKIWRMRTGDSGSAIPEPTVASVELDGPGDYAPVWQQSPPSPTAVKLNLLSHPVFERVYHGMWETRLPVLSEVVADMSFLFSEINDHHLASGLEEEPHPHSALLSPVYPTFTPWETRDRDDLTGFIAVILSWDGYFVNLLPQEVRGIYIVVRDTCEDVFTYWIEGPEATYLGEGDHHDVAYNYLEHYTEFAPFLRHNFSDTHEHCEYELLLYPSSVLESRYRSSLPVIATVVVVLVFVLTAGAFLLYDFLVERRQRKVMATAKTTTRIVSSLFPTHVRDQIMKQVEDQVEKDTKVGRSSLFSTGNNKAMLKDFLKETNEDGDHPQLNSKPIAELFTDTTIMFADIVGFTAWSSVREPSQVFTLLETVFHAFDKLAARRRIFKVETVGDCYVAVAGLPDARRDHAVVMCRFSLDLLRKMDDLVKHLEVTLGPDTGDMSLRIGLHSGQVTAGVLRGEKARFQLFGDTVNTTARIESTGETNRVHVSAQTAAILTQQGKGHWLTARSEKVEAKGKGQMQTYWLTQRGARKGPSSTVSGATQSESDEGDNNNSTAQQGAALARVESLYRRALDGTEHSEAAPNQIKATDTSLTGKTMRLIAWNVDVLARLLKQIELRRRMLRSRSGVNGSCIFRESMEKIERQRQELEQPQRSMFKHNVFSTLKHPISTTSSSDGSATSATRELTSLSASFADIAEQANEQSERRTVLDEVREIITLPRFETKLTRAFEDTSSITLEKAVMDQLRKFVTAVASMYRSNPFHNFEHASHVTMSVGKLLSRIVAPDDDEIARERAMNERKRGEADADDQEAGIAAAIHDHTYGITSDPLTQFACVFSAIIHDAEHAGVPNTILVKENSPLAATYNGKSIAEQNSVDICWQLLMDEEYGALRGAIYADPTEKERFRQLVVNSVMATDIMDKDANAFRRARWDKAFSEGQDEVAVELARTESKSDLLVDSVNRKATIVIEHLIQASDVSHTMQHWHIYCKWNERLFDELMLAYKQGRSDTDPSLNWYKGEIGFFDFYIIPLAKKLQKCGVFGVSSDEYLNYAMNNRKEWEVRGKERVAEMMEKHLTAEQGEVEPIAELKVGGMTILDEEEDESTTTTASRVEVEV